MAEAGTWKKGNNKFLFYGYSDLHSNADKTYWLERETYTLYFENIQLEDEGIYECKEKGQCISRFCLIVEGK